MNLVRIASKVASRRYAAVSVHVVTWDEIGMEWTDQGMIQIQGQFGDLLTSQKAVVEINRELNKLSGGYSDEELDAGEGWTIKSVKQVSDLAQVTPGDFDKSQADHQKEELEYAQNEGTDPPVFSQSILSGPGWAGLTYSDRNHFSLILVKP